MTLKNILSSFIFFLFLNTSSLPAEEVLKKAPPKEKTQSTPKKTPEQLALEKIQEETKKLQAEEDLKLLKFRQSIASEKQKLEALEVKAALEKKEKENSKKAQQEDFEKIDLELMASQQKHKLATQKLKEEIELLALDNQLLLEKYKKESQALADTQLKANMEREILLSAQILSEIKNKELEQNLKFRTQNDAWNSHTNKEIEYPLNPIGNGILRISDRRIELNGVIIYGVADYITERIHFFNNKSKTAPIFIVIGRSPGGSVMEGYRILKAMASSEAPIHVLVKSFAASMSAVITSLADQSYAYDNAIILHHQLSGVKYGNVAEQKKSLELFQEWGRRLHEPVAKKMGISLDSFYKKMYEHDPMGNWEEFADKAQKLRWVNHIVDRVQEESFNENPNTESYLAKKKTEQMNFAIWNGKNIDEKGKAKAQMSLPKLDAFDFYFIHNNEQYQW
jgi:ATP-dependent Clp protease protease subunit